MAMGGAGASSTAPAALLFLRPESATLGEELAKYLDPERRPKDTSLTPEVRLSDFDGVHYRIQLPSADSPLLYVGMMAPCWKDLVAAGVEEHLRSVYGDMVVAPRDGADVTLALDPAKIGAGFPDVVARVSALRRNAFAAPFERAFKSVLAKAPCAEMVVRYRTGSPVFILPRSDRVSVIFAVEFDDTTDRAIARIICQEFTEAQRHVSTGPAVNFTDKEAPLELRGKDLPKPSESFVGYITFAVFPRMFDAEAKRANALNLLTQFRGYLDYHIKAAKAYLHTRMRARVDGWMGVLNRAYPDDPFAAKEKRLASGKTFTKKA